MLAIQDQVVATRVYEKKIMNKNVSCFMPSIWTSQRNYLHLLSACPIQVGTTYVHCHNLVACAVYWHLCKHYSLPLNSKSWLSHNPLQFVRATQQNTIGFPPTNQLPSCQQLPRHCSLCLFSEDLLLKISCPGDINVSSKEEEKVASIYPWLGISI